MYPRLIDTHCHLDADTFHLERDDVVARAVASGVSCQITIGIDVATSLAAVEIAEQYDSVFAVVGIQPNYVHEVKPDDWTQILPLLDHSKVVGIGETGLDRYWDHAPLDLQREYFRRHIRLSVAHQLPFVVHCREAETEVLEVLRSEAQHGSLNGVMHSFCGDTDAAAECMQLGLYISFAGMVTFRKNEELRSVAATIPADRLLVETDAPYLAPHPRRGKRNEPSWVRLTAECLADVRGISIEELSEQTTRNAERLFGLNDG